MATQNIYDLVDTWNAGATTFTAIKMNVTDTASAAGSLLMDLQVGGTSRFSVKKDGFVFLSTNGASGGSFSGDASGRIFVRPFSGIGSGHLASGSITLDGTGTFGFAPTSPDGTADITLARDAADTLAQRRGTNAQAFRVYNTFTDASNYERAKIAWSTNVLQIGTEKLGTGTARALDLQTDGTSRWSIGATTGHFLAATDNSFDIGASGANRPRTVYAATNVVTPRLDVGTQGILPSAGGGSDFLLYRNNAGTELFRMTSAGLLTFAGTTSAFPALKRDGAGVSIRLADDSAATFIKHNPVTVASLPAAATAGAGARMFVSDALAPTFGSAVAGGGAVTVPVYSTGSAWNVG